MKVVREGTLFLTLHINRTQEVHVCIVRNYESRTDECLQKVAASAAETRPSRRELFRDENDENIENNCHNLNNSSSSSSSRRLVIDDHDYGNNGGATR